MPDVAMVLLFGMIGEPELYGIWGVNRDNMYGHVMGFFPRNILYYPIVAALLVGGMISPKTGLMEQVQCTFQGRLIALTMLQ